MKTPTWVIFLPLPILIGIFSFILLPQGGYDWRNSIGPGSRDFLHPFDYDLLHAPYETILLLPERLATALINALCTFSIVLVIYKLKGPAWGAIPVLFNPFAYFMFVNGQTDGLVILGILGLETGWGHILLAIKPQVAIGAVITTLRLSQWKAWIPVLCVGLLSLLIWGLWPLRLFGYHVDTAQWNWGVFPYGVPFGLLLLYLAWRRDDPVLGVIATPLIFPYVNAPSWIGALTVLAARFPKWFTIIWAITHIFWISVFVLSSH